MKVCAFDSPCTESSLNVYEMGLTTSDGNRMSIQVYEKPSLGLEINPVSTTVIEKWREQGVSLSDTPHSDIPAEIHVLLGADVANSILIGKKTVDKSTVWNTELGWVLSGPDTKLCKVNGTLVCASASVSAVQFCPTSAKSSDEVVQALWELESCPPYDPTLDMPMFPLEETDDGYCVGLLWKSGERPADNRKQAEGAARQLYGRLSRNKQRGIYEDVLLREYQELGAVEREPEPETPGYYMPHHAVIRESTTTKTRVVFNASAAQKGQKSLNDVIHAGPSLLPDLVGLLLRFRECQSAVQADIRKAFFMVGVRDR